VTESEVSVRDQLASAANQNAARTEKQLAQNQKA
jgi:hypothetical protein